MFAAAFPAAIAESSILGKAERLVSDALFTDDVVYAIFFFSPTPPCRHILSSGDSLYTNDARFVATHEPTQSTYTLQIKFVQKRDHGVYECQVSDGLWGRRCVFGKHPPTHREI